MPKPYKIFAIILACNGLCFNATAQTISSDSSLLQSSVDNAIDLHKKGLAENLRLYNGTGYTGSYSGTKGFPFFESDSLKPGALFYDGGNYKSVPMLYDLTTDEVIIEAYKHDYNIKLVTDKISYFSLSGHEFIRLNKDSTHGSIINTGFYDLLYSNQSQVFVKREKKLQQIAKLEGIDARYLNYYYYFIKRNNIFYKIESSGSLLDAFADKKDEVKTYLRKNGFHFKKNPELTLVKAASFYDQLTK